MWAEVRAVMEAGDHWDDDDGQLRRYLRQELMITEMEADEAAETEADATALLAAGDEKLDD